MLQSPEVEYGKRVRTPEHTTLGTKKVANAAVTPAMSRGTARESTIVSQAAEF